MELPAPDLSRMRVPTGFRIQTFAENVGNARILAIGPSGNVYVTRREQGDRVTLSCFMSARLVWLKDNLCV